MLPYFKDGSIKAINKLLEVDFSNAANTLIMLDVDDTIIKPFNSYDFEAKVMEISAELNLTTAQSMLLSYQEWLKDQHNKETILIDHGIYSLLEQAKQLSNDIIAFTARGETAAEITFQQIFKHQIKLSPLPKFSFKKVYKNLIFPDKKWCAKEINKHICEYAENKYTFNASRFHKGILLAGNLNEKGKVFVDFYKEYQAYCIQHSRNIPSKVIFVDDKLDNVKSVAAASDVLGIKFEGYWFEREKTLY